MKRFESGQLGRLPTFHEIEDMIEESKYLIQTHPYQSLRGGALRRLRGKQRPSAEAVVPRDGGLAALAASVVGGTRGDATLPVSTK
eukprot:12407381-Karenia_brevis.AAC.1